MPYIPVKEKIRKPQYVVTGGVKPYSFDDLDTARRLAVMLTEKHSIVITIKKEDSDEVYKYARGKEIEV